MSSFIGVIVGTLEIAAGIALIFTGVGIAVSQFLIFAGAGTLLTGLGTLVSNAVTGTGSFASSSGGVSIATRNPVGSWVIPYGRCCVGGTVIYVNSFGDTDQWLDFIIDIADCQIESFDALLFNKQLVQLSTSGGAFTGIGDSFTPVQQTVNILTITRLNGVVTCTMDAAIPLMTPGTVLLIQTISGAPTLEGRFPVESTASGNTVFTYICGGTNTTVTLEGTVSTQWADYGRKVHCEVLLGNQTSTFPGMISGTAYDGDTSNLVVPPPANAAWNAACVGQGHALVFLRLHYDQATFSGGIPTFSFLIHGRNQIYDSRSGTTGYTENAALCIADFLANTTWGMKAAYATEIPYAQLTAAANICDEAVALAPGGTEPRYACNGKFDLSMKRGEVLKGLLTSCAGRITYQGGQFAIWPGAWYGSSPAPAPGPGGMSGPFRWLPTVSIRDLYNGVKGTFVCPANNWQASDIPPYAQDTTHGYTTGAAWSSSTAYVIGQIVVSVGIDYVAIANNTNALPSSHPADWQPIYQDINLIADGGDRRWLDIRLPFTISPAAAQRICKIELLRRRWQGTGTFRYNMSGYPIATMDVITETVAYMGWSAKAFEVLSKRFTSEKQENAEGAAVALLGVEIDVQESDSSIYDWSDSEELTPQGYQQPYMPDPTTPAPPTNVTLESDSSTVVTTPAGIADSILVSWDAPADGFVTEGGHMEVQYQEIENYTTGTVQVTASNTAVVGTGTSFTSEMEGGTLTVNNVSVGIQAVIDATHLTLAAGWTGSSGSGQTFIVAFSDAWVGLPSVNPTVTQVTINGVIDGNQYYVQIRSVAAGGAPSAWIPAGPIIASGARVPLPYHPFSSPYLAADALFPGRSTFSTYTAPGEIALFGKPTVNVLSTLTFAPQVPAQATVSGSGTIPAGNYKYSVVAVDTNGRKSAPSHHVSAAVLSGSSQITITGITFDVNAVKWELYDAINNFELASDVVANPVTYGASGLTPDGIGQPDPLTARIRVIITPIRHGGIWGSAASAIASNVITIPSTPTADQWAGRILSLYGSQKVIESGGIGSATWDGLCYAKPANFNVTANTTAGAMTVTQSTLISGFAFTFVNDPYVMRAVANIASSNTIGDSGFVNSFAPSGLATDSERGKIVWIIAKLGAGQKASISGNTSTTLTINGSWAVTPDSTSVFVVLEPSPALTIDCPKFQWDGTGINAVSLAVAKNLPFTTAGTQSFLIQVVTLDASGNASAVEAAPWQEVYVPEIPGGETAQSTISTTPYNVQVDDDVLTFAGGASVVNLPDLSLVIRHPIYLLNNSVSTLTLNPFSGDSVTAQSSILLTPGATYIIMPNS